VDVSNVTGASINESPFSPGGNGRFLYVNAATGSDSNSGNSPASAFKTLGKAVSTAHGGSYLGGGFPTKIVVAPGRYPGDIHVNGALSNAIRDTLLVIEGTRKGEVIVDGAANFSGGWTVVDAANGIYRRSWTVDFGEDWADITDNDASLPINPTGVGPKRLTTVGGLHNRVELSWSAATQSGLAGYRVYRRGPGESGYSLLATVPATVTTFSDTTVLSSTSTITRKYFYYVTSFNGSGTESPRSNGAWAIPWDPADPMFETPVGRRGEQVWINGALQRQVDSYASLLSTPGSFFVDEGYLGDPNDGFLYIRTTLDPNSAIIEATTTPVRDWNFLLKLDLKANVVIRNLDFERSRRGGLLFQNSPGNLLIEDCDFSWNSLNGLEVLGATSGATSTGFTIRRITADHNGERGMGTGWLNNYIVEDSRFNANNWRGDWVGRYSWDRQGYKSGSCWDGIVRRSDFVGNLGLGLWLDTDMQNVEVSEIMAIDNYRVGIDVEASQGPVLIRNSVMARNGSSGFYFSETDHVTLDGNLLFRNGGFDPSKSGDLNTHGQIRFSARTGGRTFTRQVGGNYTTFTRDNTIRNNVVVSHGSIPIIQKLNFNSDQDYLANTLATLTAANNTYFNPDGTGTMFYVSDGDTTRNEPEDYDVLAGWQARLAGPPVNNPQDTTASGTRWHDPNIRGEFLLARQLWDGVPGNGVDDLRSQLAFPWLPSNVQSNVTTLETPTIGDQYGQRIVALLVPPEEGQYVFWIAADESAELWLGSDASPSSATRIAWTTAPTNRREWSKFASQRSSPITLSRSGTYYLAVLHKEGSGADHLAVGWSKPGGSTLAPDEVINGSVLVPLVETPAAPFAPSSLQATTISTGRVDLSWNDGSLDEDSFIIERSVDGSNWTQVGTTARNVTTFQDLTVAPGTIYSYRVRAVNFIGGSSWSNIASANTTPPRVRGVAWNDVNGNGTRDPGESGLAGRVIFADANQNGVLDPPVNGSGGERSATSDANGDFLLEFDAPGTYTLRQVLPDNWFATTPVDAAVVDVGFGAEQTRHFGSRQFIPGDLNGDGAVNNQDIAPFVLALTDPADYAAQHPAVPLLVVGDINGDGVVNNQDIAPFVALLTGGRAPAGVAPATTTSGAIRGPWHDPRAPRVVVRRDDGVLPEVNDRRGRADYAELTVS
jgi:hypothetical protein